jgi:hypothetical protein
MKVPTLKIPAVVALALSAVTSANAAMPVAPAGIDRSIVLVDCAWGWYRGPDGQCYVNGTGPYRGGGAYYRQRDWRGGEGDEYFTPPYPHYRYYRPPYVIEDDDY